MRMHERKLNDVHLAESALHLRIFSPCAYLRSMPIVPRRFVLIGVLLERVG